MRRCADADIEEKLTKTDNRSLKAREREELVNLGMEAANETRSLETEQEKSKIKMISLSLN